MNLINLATPLIIATLFTAGGWAILRVRHRAQDIGVALFGLFVVCTVLVGATLLGQQLERVPGPVAQGPTQTRLR